MAATIAFIGLGKLGLPMAARLAAAGHVVQGYDREAAQRDLAAARGIKPLPTLTDAITGASVVFSSLPDDKALTGLCSGPEGLLAKFASDTIYADTSTVSPQASALIGAEADTRKIAYVRLPMSGNPVLAEAGTLTCFASGPKPAFDTLQPMLGAMTRAQTWLGSGEEARYAKLAVNLMIAVSAGMMAEALVLARKGGIAWSAMLDVVAESAVGSPFVKYKVPPLAKRDFSSTFSSRQMAKDLDLILAAARSAEIAMPLAALMREAYSSLAAQGHGDEDFIAVVKQAEMLAGLGEPDAT